MHTPRRELPLDVLNPCKPGGAKAPSLPSLHMVLVAVGHSVGLPLTRR
jgi:hypothetical protein